MIWSKPRRRLFCILAQVATRRRLGNTLALRTKIWLEFPWESMFKAPKLLKGSDYVEFVLVTKKSLSLPSFFSRDFFEYGTALVGDVSQLKFMTLCSLVERPLT